MGLAKDREARARAVAFAAQAAARVTLLAVGSPQQELLALDMARSGAVRGTALCIGAGVEFLLGIRARAPRPIQRAGLEWAWRLLVEPRRMWRRYLVDGPAIFPLVWRWRRARGRPAR
jgi:exopolysaccharide biosynthesis WecB/TagA/CpsF family protein